MTKEEILELLQRRKPGLEAFDPVWDLIEAAFSGQIKTRGEAGYSSKYLPKGRLEAPSEYSLRVEMTPFFPQTPAIVASRLGALFETGLTVTGDRGMQDFAKAAGRRHATLEDVASQAATLVQVHGFCAALIDREPLPADTAGRVVTVAEASARSLARPYIAVYTARNVLDWEYAADGRLAWVKFGESCTRRDAWNGATVDELNYRIVDRVNTTVYHVTQGADHEWHIVQDAPVPHGFAGRVPVVFCHPFPHSDGLGRPVLRRMAESDISATRVLSDLCWDLFVLGNPILTYKTSRPDNEHGQLGIGASRYIPLRAGNKMTGDDGESLEFVQLDATGLELLFRAHSLFAAEGSIEKTAGDETSVGIPQQASGISQAWRFKTGEERVLFMLARALEPFINETLELAAIAMGKSARPTVTFPRTFGEGAIPNGTEHPSNT